MKTCFTLLLSTFLLVSASGQGIIEGGIFAGLSNYGGDLSENYMELTETNPSFGILGRYYFKDWLSLRASLTYGTLSGSDKNASNIGRRRRNLSFRSSIVELAVIPEFNIYSFKLSGGQTITPYVMIGASAFYYNPKTLYEGNWIELQPLGTEGQGLPGYDSKYSLISFAIPSGIGVKFAVSDKASIALEFTSRYTFTDYLDDVSTVYPDNDVLAASSNDVNTAILSDRTAELTGVPVERNANAMRGTENVDVFYLFGATVSINLFTPEVMDKKMK
jgi:hypothetical protein